VPSLASVSPGVACSEQVATNVGLQGSGFAPLHVDNLVAPRLELPHVNLTRTADLDGGPAGEVVQVPDAPGALQDVTWTSPEEMSFTVCPPGTCSTATPPKIDYALAPGLYTVGVKNPSGASAELPSSLLIVPPPILTRAEPDLLGADRESTLVLSGDFFIRWRGQNGTVAVGDTVLPIAELDDCRDLLPAGRDSSGRVESCRTARVVVPAGAFAQGTYALVAGAPGGLGCHSLPPSEPVTLTLVRGTTVSEVHPDLLCGAQGERSMTMSGADFLVVDGALPTVLVDETEYAPTGAGDCTDVTGPGLREHVQQCSTLAFSLPAGELSAGVHAVSVRNPPPADDTSAAAAGLLVIAPPVLDSVESDVVCTAQDERVLALSGAGFVFFDEPASAPTVTFTTDGWTAATLPAQAVDASCEALSGIAEAARVCTRATVKLDQATLGLGIYQVALTNPDPAGCTSPAPRSLLVVPPPSAVELSPRAICNAATGSSSILVDGEHFTVVGDRAPQLRIAGDAGGEPVTVSTVPSRCRVIGGEGLAANTTETVLECTRLAAAVPAGAAAGATSFTAQVVGVEQVGCASSPLALGAASGPTLAGLAGSRICVGGGSISVQGSNLGPDTTFALVASGGSPAFAAERAVLSDCSADGQSCNAAALSFGVTPAGSYTVHASLAGQCESVLAAPIPVASGPLVFSVDPSIVYSGIATSASVHVANLGGAEIQAITIFPDGDDPAASPSALRFTGADLDTNRPGRAVVRLPEGLAAGSWSVLADVNGACTQSLLSGALTVVQELTPGLVLTLAPSFGRYSENVPVTITTTLALDAIPLVYLSSATTPSATALVAVSLQSPHSIAAVVPANRLEPGRSYDLVLVGTSGGAVAAGLAPDAWTANLLPTPVVTSVVPESLPTGTDPVRVLGANFSPTTTLQLACIDTGDHAVAPPIFSAGPTVASSSEIGFTATFTSQQAVCDVIVTNEDGSSFRWSSIVVQNPAQKLGSFGASSPMRVTRRGLGSTAARANATSRFLYAIGGDAGSEDTATGSVEVAGIDAAGRLGPWTLLPATARGAAGVLVGPSLALRTPHTFTRAVTIGPWIWVVGGSDGTGATADVERAFVLDPLNVVTLADVDISLDTEGGLGGGTWLYRVAPVLADDDPYSPGGELLASEPMSVRLPAAVAGGVDVTVRWERFASAGRPAAKYNVYRTPDQSKLGNDDVIWIGQVDGTRLEFTDRGGIPAKPFVHPLPVGSVGTWQTTAPDAAGTSVVDLALLKPRSGAGVAVVRDPVVQVPGRDVYYLYAVAGNTGTESAVAIDDGSEWMVVELDTATRLPYVSRFQAGTEIKLAKPGGAETPHGKWQASAFAGSPDSIPYDAGEGYLYLASGLRSSAADEVIAPTHVFAPIVFGSGAVPAGQPTAWAEANPSGFGGQAGYAGTFVNGFAYGLGGMSSMGVLDSCVQSQNLTTPLLTTGTMSNPSSCSVFIQARMLAAAANASGFLFVLGGSALQAPSPDSAATTVERAVY